MDKSYQTPQGRLLPTFVLFVFVVLLLYTIFLVLQNILVNRDIKRMTDTIGELNLQMEELESEGISEVFVAQELKNQVEADSVAWSQVLAALQNLTPVTVFFSSYSAGEGGDIQVSGLGDSYAAVANTVRLIDESDDFSDVFVPSLTSGTTGEGQSVVSFSLTLQF